MRVKSAVRLVATVWVASMTIAAPVHQAHAEGNCGATAAATQQWGTPLRTDDFSDPGSLGGWYLYDGPGHDGNGRRTPTAASVSDGLLTITGDAAGDSEGMAWTPGRMYGRWEVCAKSSVASPNYHSVLLLWPSGSGSGEVDFMEIADPTRQSVDGFVHYAVGGKLSTTLDIDATAWHSWAVEWTAQRLAFFVDGRQWWETTDTAAIPDNAMVLCVQLDNFGGDISQGGQLVVDWTREYPPTTS